MQARLLLPRIAEQRLRLKFLAYIATYNHTPLTNLVSFGMIYAYQTAALVARHHSVFLPKYISNMSAVNQCIAIWTSWCFADTMLYKSKKKQCNTQKHKYLVQYIQPITAKYSKKAEGECNDIAYPICFFHPVSLLCQIGIG